MTEDIPIVPSKLVPDDIPHIPLNFRRLSDEDQEKISSSFRNSVKNYPQVKKFSSKKVPKEIIENCLKTAGIQMIEQTFNIVPNQTTVNEKVHPRVVYTQSRGHLQLCPIHTWKNKSDI